VLCHHMCVMSSYVCYVIICVLCHHMCVMSSYVCYVIICVFWCTHIRAHTRTCTHSTYRGCTLGRVSCMGGRVCMYTWRFCAEREVSQRDHMCISTCLHSMCRCIHIHAHVDVCSHVDMCVVCL